MFFRLKKDRNMFGIFESRTLRMFHGPINGSDIRRRRYINEVYTLYDELCVVKGTKIGRQTWIQQL
jgi:hypothetical protein